MVIREIEEADLVGLLELYRQLHENPMPRVGRNLLGLWAEILGDKNHHIIVAVEEDQIVSSCVLMVVPNLTRNQRPYALIENVITEEGHRGQGLATACLDYARELAKGQNCYKTMLLTGSKTDSTLNFYRRAGYNSEDKTAFIQWL